MKDNSKTRALLSKLRGLYNDRCALHWCKCCTDVPPSCEACRKLRESNERERENIKSQLKTLPHIPNKKEAKQIRKDRKRQGR